MAAVRVAVWIAVLMCAIHATASAAERLLARPDDPGPNVPTQGRSLFDELFEVGPPARIRAEARYAIPYPFERLLASVEAQIAPSTAKAVLIPYGRSLQRFAADPDFVASPRLVVAVDEAGTDRPNGAAYLKDRLFLGYQERARVIEVISYNEDAGRFEFQVVEDYDAAGSPRVVPAERALCVTCHQGHAPIFPTALWSETNANPAVSELLSAHGESFHGVPAKRGVDIPDAFDRATDRANRLAFANFVWNTACAEPDDREAARCRGDLLLAALGYRLGGSRVVPELEGSRYDDTARRLRRALERAAPDGIGSPSPDLPNRDPLHELAAGVDVLDAIEPEGPFDPTHRRAAIWLWRPSQPDAQLFRDVVAEIADFFAPWNVARIDALLRERDRNLAKVDHFRSPCRMRDAEGRGGGVEIRVDCRAEAGRQDAMELTAHFVVDGDSIDGGVVRSLALPGHAPIHYLAVRGGTRRNEDGSDAFRLVLGEAAKGLTARLAAGPRLSELVVTRRPDGGADAEIGVIDDLQPLRATVADMVSAASESEEGPLASGPIRRRALLSDLFMRLAAADREDD